jgi:2-hydroxychromene-2-carboxylate isomerase
MDGPDDTLWYFAFGSNMSPGTFVERRRMRPLATRWGWLAGHRLCFDLPIGPGERGCASVVADPDARVGGVLYRITDDDAARLDRTELGYRRIAVEVDADGGGRLAAFTYQSTLSKPGRLPSRRYLDLLLDGARTHGLPADYVAWLDGFDRAFDERGLDGATLEERTVRFYFAYDEPAAVRASARMAAEIVALDVAIDPRPLHHDHRARPAAIGFAFARGEGRGVAYHEGVCAALLRDGDDVLRPDALADVAERAGIGRSRFVAALAEPRWAAVIDDHRRAADADGVAGCPTIVLGDRRFHGDGALAALARALASPAGSRSPAAAR